MIDGDNIQELAAEYVVGTLSAKERAAVNERRRDDKTLDQAIQHWEQHLAPLLEGVSPVPPPQDLFDKIQSRLAQDDVPAVGNVISMEQHRKTLAARTRPWRIATGAMSAVAASLVGLLVVGGPQTEKKMKASYVAVLQEKTQTPAFLMTVDMKSHMCAIKSVISPPEPGKSYELWMVHESWDQPKSLGLIAQNDMEMMPMSPDIEPDLYMNATFAVSLEPAGGSPTGLPTGPVQYAGRLVQATP